LCNVELLTFPHMLPHRFLPVNLRSISSLSSGVLLRRPVPSFPLLHTLLALAVTVPLLCAPLPRVFTSPE
jgi:hypothetical protein